MKKIDKRIQEVLERGERVLVSGVPVGYPSLEETRRLVDLYIESGIDIVEFSMPAKDPYIDSKIIAESNVRALDLEPNLDRYFDTMYAIRKERPDEPFYMMAYADLIQSYGLEEFVKHLVKIGIDGIELPDKDEMVPELAEELDALLKDNEIYRIYILHHPFDEEYLEEIAKDASGFIILQSAADQKGERPKVLPDNRTHIEKVRANTDIPVILGYGIRDAERAKEAVAMEPDGVLVGTSMVEHINDGDYQKFSEFICEMKKATLLR